MKKLKFKIYLLAIMALFAISCNRNAVAKASPLDIIKELPKYDNSKIDSTIQKAIQSIDSCDEVQMQVQIITLAQKLTDCEEVNAELLVLINQKPTGKTKIKNSFNDVQKNSNNQTEVYKLKKSIAAISDSFAAVNAENLSLKEKLRLSDGSVNGNNNTTDNSKEEAKKGGIVGNGNTQDNSNSIWPWILVGVLGCFIFQNIFLRWLKTYLPFLKILF